jgi:hypothetical protein
VTLGGGEPTVWEDPQAGKDFYDLIAVLHASADRGCGANDWFVSITEEKIVKSCSFIDRGRPLLEPTCQALLAATQELPRLPCYRSYQTSTLAQIAQPVRQNFQSRYGGTQASRSPT